MPTIDTLLLILIAYLTAGAVAAGSVAIVQSRRILRLVEQADHRIRQLDANLNAEHDDEPPPAAPLTVADQSRLFAPPPGGD